MKKLLLFAGLLLIPSIGFGMQADDYKKSGKDASDVAKQVINQRGKSEVTVGQIKKYVEDVISTLNAELSKNEAGSKTYPKGSDLKKASDVAISNLDASIAAWEQGLKDITDLIQAQRAKFLEAEGTKAVDLKQQVKTAAAADNDAKNIAIFGQL